MNTKYIIAAFLVTAGCAGSSQDMNDPEMGSGHNAGVGSTAGSGSGGMGGGSGVAGGVAYTVVDLVADSPALGAQRVDPNLVNAWGIAAFDNAFFIADNGSGLMSVYDALGADVSRGTLNLGDGISGVAVNPSMSTDMMQMHSSTTCANARLLVSSESGAIIGVDPDVSPAMVQTVIDHTNVNAVYKGIAIAQASDGSLMILASDFHNGRIDVFDGNFQPIVTAAGAPAMFADPRIPAGMAPFNIAVIGDSIFVTYATQDADKHDDVPGTGALAKFDMSGKLVGDLIGGPLNSPWGMAMASASFCGSQPSQQSPAQADLIVGNFGDGTIAMIDPVKVGSLGLLADRQLIPLHLDGLWGLTFGDGVANEMAGSLYFTAGPNMESDGLFGRIDVAQ